MGTLPQSAAYFIGSFEYPASTFGREPLGGEIIADQDSAAQT